MVPGRGSSVAYVNIINNNTHGLWGSTLKVLSDDFQLTKCMSIKKFSLLFSALPLHTMYCTYNQRLSGSFWEGGLSIQL